MQNLFCSRGDSVFKKNAPLIKWGAIEAQELPLTWR
jgi:hypothetical protein